MKILCDDCGRKQRVQSTRTPKREQRDREGTDPAGDIWENCPTCGSKNITYLE